MVIPDFDDWFWSLNEEEISELEEDYDGAFERAYTDMIAMHADFYNDEQREMNKGVNNGNSR